MLHLFFTPVSTKGSFLSTCWSYFTHTSLRTVEQHLSVMNKTYSQYAYKNNGEIFHGCVRDGVKPTSISLFRTFRLSFWCRKGKKLMNITIYYCWNKQSSLLLNWQITNIMHKFCNTCRFTVIKKMQIKLITAVFSWEIFFREN